MAVPYHTHTFEIPAASASDVEAGTRDDVVLTPAVVGSAATKDVEYFATAGQGSSADTAVQAVNGKTGQSITITKSDVGLGSADDTPDSLKPVSNATQSALNLKANISSLGSAAYTPATDYATSAQGQKADTAIQAPGGTLGQVLVKNSATNNDVIWQTIAAATAVSYAPQSLTEPQKQQARQNIGALDDAAIASSPTKDTPVDADAVVITDSADSGKSKRVLWSRVKAVLQAFFDNRYLRFIGGTLTGPLALLSPRSNAAVGDRNYTPAYIGRIGDANLEVTLFGEERVGTDVRAVISARSGSVINYFAFTHLGDLEVSRSVHCSDVRASGWLYSGTATFRTDGNIFGSKWNDSFGNFDAAEGINARIEARSFARTRDYLLSEAIPVGGYAMLRYSGTAINPQSVGGGELQWSNSNGDISSPLNYGTFQPIGTTNTASNAQRTTIWKRIG